MVTSVSYTHLDVYKRQKYYRTVLINWIVRPTIIIRSILRLVRRVIHMVTVVIIRTVVVVIILVTVVEIFVFAPVVPLSAPTIITLSLIHI